MTSKSATASLALFDCSGPMRCSSTSGIARAQSGPFRLGLLHVVLAEDPLAGGENRLDGVRRKRLGNGHQGDRRRIALTVAGGADDRRADLVQSARRNRVRSSNGRAFCQAVSCRRLPCERAN